MSKTDKKKRKLAGQIGESFVALRRRMIQSPAWRSLSGSSIKLYCELKLTYRHKRGEQNNGLLFLSVREAETTTGMSMSSASRAYAELEAKGFIVQTRAGEAGRLRTSATLENGGSGYARQAACWAITEEPWFRNPASHAYERWRPGLRWDREKSDFVPDSKQPQEPEKQFHASAYGSGTLPPTEARPENASVDGSVEADSQFHYASASGTLLSTIYPGPADGAPRASNPTKADWAELRRAMVAGGTRVSGHAVAHRSPPVVEPERPKRKGGGWYGARGECAHWPAPERRALGLTQDQLATRAGVKRPYLATLERGKRRPGPEIRARLEEALSGRRTA